MAQDNEITANESIINTGKHDNYVNLEVNFFIIITIIIIISDTVFVCNLSQSSASLDYFCYSRHQACHFLLERTSLVPFGVDMCKLLSICIHVCK